MTQDNQHTDAFYRNMDADPKAVYIVEVYNGIERQQLGVFSTKENAEEWMATLGFTCVCCPFIIDEPDFGNVRKQ